MQPASACRICSGTLELARQGRTDAATPQAFAPTCHETGAHGTLLRCVRCGTVQQPDLPTGEALLALYRDMEDPAYLDEEPGRRRAAQRLLDLLAPHAPRGRFLDVGCGHGLLVDEARKRGFASEGLDLSRAAAAHARDVLGLRVRELTVDAAELDAERFDVVVLSDVLEHVEDPCATLDRCRELLADRGVLAVITPDPASRTARIAGARWWGLLPAHVCLIPHATLLELLTQRGLAVREDVPLVRFFSPGYWLAGLGGRSPLLSRLTSVAGRVGGRRLWGLSLGDERVVLGQCEAAG